MGLPDTLRAMPPLPRRLWKAGIAWLLFITTILIANQFVAQDRHLSASMLARDFLPFYTAGTFVRTDQLGRLYELDAVLAYERRLATTYDLELGTDAVGPWLNPPHAALLFAPLSVLPFPAAAVLWVLGSFACIAVSIGWLMRMLRDAGQPAHVYWLLPLIVGTSLPFIQTLCHGQNTGISLLILVATVHFWRLRRGFVAGAVLGLLYYKPQLAMIVSLALLIDLRREALLGLLATGVVTLVATLIVLPGTLHAFLTETSSTLHAMQIENSYFWFRHVTLHAFWRLLLQGSTPGELAAGTSMMIFVSAALVVAGLIWFRMTRCRSRVDTARSQLARDEWICLSICATPLLVPYFLDYDLLLLAVPATLTVLTAGRSERLERGVRFAWIGLAVVMIAHPAIARFSGVILAVPFLLAVLCSTMIRPRSFALPRQSSLEAAGLQAA